MLLRIRVHRTQNPSCRRPVRLPVSHHTRCELSPAFPSAGIPVLSAEATVARTLAGGCIGFSTIGQQGCIATWPPSRDRAGHGGASCPPPSTGGITIPLVPGEPARRSGCGDAPSGRDVSSFLAPSGRRAAPDPPGGSAPPAGGASPRACCAASPPPEPPKEVELTRPGGRWGRSCSGCLRSSQHDKGAPCRAPM